MEKHLMVEVFDLLKRTLKARKMTYEALAIEMELSIPTVKRLFVDRDCKFSRLITICEILDLPFGDLMDLAHRSSVAAGYLPEETELALSEHPDLLSYYSLLRESLSTDQIAQHYQLSEADTLLYCRDLERLSLLKLNSFGQVSLPNDTPFKVRIDGPLNSLYAKINIDFIAFTLRASTPKTDPNVSFESLSRQLRPETADQINMEIEDLLLRINRYARQDSMVSHSDELYNYKWTVASAPISLNQLVKVSPHRENKKSARK